jgi:hypothetical protein
MRATRLLFLGLAALAVTVPAGCAVKVGDQAAKAPRAAAAKAPREEKKKRIRDRAKQLIVVPAGLGKALAVAIPKEGLPDAAAFQAAVSWEVKGWGRNQEEAEQDALARARHRLAAHLRKQERPLVWTPPTKYIRTHLVTGPSTRRDEDDQVVEGIKTECWALPVAITPMQYGELVKQDRLYRAHLRKQERDARSSERMLLAGKVMAGLLVVLVGLIGYLRLDEWTGGAYTRWLRFGLGGVLTGAGVGVGLWLLT